MRGYKWIILLLAFSSFCLGVAEFIVSGVLTDLSKFYGVLDSDVGYLATLYACGVVIGAPIVSVLISSWNYRIQLCFTLGVFCISNAIVFWSASLLIALLARFVSGLMHGLFFVIATIISLKVAPQDKRSMALSLMASGLTLALVSGVPLGIFLSRHYGILSPFAFIAVVSCIVAISAFFIMPRLRGKQGSFKNLCVAFSYPALCQGFVITALTCGSMFVVYIYMRVLLENHGFDEDSIAQAYLYFGLAAVVGNLFGGKLTDLKGSFFACCAMLCVQICMLTFMSFSHLANSPLLLLANIIGFAFFGFAFIAPLKMLCAHLAHIFTPETKNDTIALNEGAFNVGIAFASLIGGLVMRYMSVDMNGICAALFALGALLTLLLGIRKVYYKGA